MKIFAVNIFVLLVSIYVLSAQTDTRNYVLETTVRKANIFGTSQIENITTDYKQQTVNYFDGLGRLSLNISIAASPEGYDIIQPFNYNNYGQQTKSYLPYTSDRQSNGDFIELDASLTEAENFHGTSNFYSETKFEQSPLNRVLEKAPPGDIPDKNDHLIKTEYLTNGANQVIKFKVDNYTGHYRPVGFYPEASLRITKTTDENGNISLEYKDSSGKVILTERLVSDNNSDLVSAKTVTIYDDFDRPRYIFSPEGSKALYSGNGAYNEDIVNKYAFYYRYDNRGLVIKKKLPGSDTVFIIYNRKDLPIMTQNAELRRQNRWTFTKYDAFNRPLITGIIRFSSRDKAQPENIQIALAQAESVVHEQFDADNTRNHQYTDNAFPYLSAFSDKEIHTVHYYDNYQANFCSLMTYKTYDDFYSDNPDTIPKGLATAAKTFVPQDSSWIYTVNYYDQYLRNIQTQTTNKNNAGALPDYDRFVYTDIITNQYEQDCNAAGYLIKSLQEHSSELRPEQDNSVETLKKHDVKLRYRYIYDHSGRLISTQEYLNDELIPGQETEKTYNEKSELQNTKFISNNIDNNQASSDVIQSTDYEYNMRGWLTKINDPLNLGNDNFALSLSYWGNVNPEYAQYNGNISKMIWNATGYNTPKQYTFEYDELNRLIKAEYSPENSFDTRYTYDLNGNIISLNRNAEFEQISKLSPFGEPVMQTNTDEIDDLSYRYSGNKLVAVDDRMNSATHQKKGFTDNGSFFDQSLQQAEYYYDTNGNMTYDNNKGITIEYNKNTNLPEKISESQNAYLKYIYDAAGVKLAKEVHRDGGHTRTDYIGNFVYEDYTLLYILTDYGRILVHTTQEAQPDDSTENSLIRKPEPVISHTYTREFHLKDHLGNVRAVIDEKGELVQQTDYYPFGMSFTQADFSADNANKYLYNGKEMQEDFDLDWLDYGARFYDAEIGRWHVVDPLAEQAPNCTPYRYAFNNPMIYIDPDGLFEIVKPTSEEALTMVKNTLTEEDAQYVQLDENGNIDADLLNQAESNSGNLAELKTLVNDERTYEVSVSSEIEYKTETGEVKTRAMGDIYYTDFITGEPIEASGWRGVCQTPGSEPNKYNSVDDNVRIHVNKNLNERDRAKVFSHEAYGHGSFYSQGKDHFHRVVNMKDTNTALKNQIDNRVNETEKNYDARGN